MGASRSHGAGMWVNQTKNRFGSLRGIRFDNRKLISSRSGVLPATARIVIFLKTSSNKDCSHGGGNHHRRRLHPGCHEFGGVGDRPESAAGGVGGEAQVSRRAWHQCPAPPVPGAVLTVWLAPE